jgi:hypothetical protein
MHYCRQRPPEECISERVKICETLERAKARDPALRRAMQKQLVAELGPIASDAHKTRGVA